jgi:arylsulfatase A-like enzyme
MGKWHLSEGSASFVPKEFRAGYNRWLAANCVELITGPYSLSLFDEENKQVDLPGYRVDAQTDAMIRYIDEKSKEPEKPFLLFHSFLEPHHQNTDDSYPAPDGYQELYKDAYMPPDLKALEGSVHRQWAGYCGMVKRLDEALGRTLDSLKSRNMDKNTIIVFISDHGCHFKTRNSEYKRSPHESSVRIPFVIWGDQWNGGGEHKEPVSLVDLMPSLLDSAHIDIPQSVEGNSLLKLVRSEKKNWPKESYIQFGDSFVAPGRAIRTDRWKYVVAAKDQEACIACAESYVESELYDLQCDPYELNNLIGSEVHDSIKDDLRARTISWMEKLKETSTKIEKVSDTNSHIQYTVDYPDQRNVLS